MSDSRKPMVICSSQYSTTQTTVFDDLLQNANTANRAGVIVLVHDHLYMRGNMSEVGTRDLIVDLLKLLRSGLGRESVILTFDIVDAQINVDTTTPLGLMVCEIVTNTHKYAFGADGGTIHVGLSDSGTSLVLTIRDDGCGFDPASARAKAGSLGFSLIEDMVIQMEAKLDVRSDDRGSQWTILGIARQGRAVAQTARQALDA